LKEDLEGEGEEEGKVEIVACSEKKVASTEGVEEVEEEGVGRGKSPPETRV